jgi:hypothetical protein
LRHYTPVRCPSRIKRSSEARASRAHLTCALKAKSAGPRPVLLARKRRQVGTKRQPAPSNATWIQRVHMLDENPTTRNDAVSPIMNAHLNMTIVQRSTADVPSAVFHTFCVSPTSIPTMTDRKAVMATRRKGHGSAEEDVLETICRITTTVDVAAPKKTEKATPRRRDAFTSNGATAGRPRSPRLSASRLRRVWIRL